jgi:hypothetical protein
VCTRLVHEALASQLKQLVYVLCLNRCVEALEEHGEVNPRLHKHRFWLLLAEQQRWEGNRLVAEEAYEKAIEEAEEGHFLQVSGEIVYSVVTFVNKSRRTDTKSFSLCKGTLSKSIHVELHTFHAQALGLFSQINDVSVNIAFLIECLSIYACTTSLCKTLTIQCTFGWASLDQSHLHSKI